MTDAIICRSPVATILMLAATSTRAPRSSPTERRDRENLKDDPHAENDQRVRLGNNAHYGIVTCYPNEAAVLPRTARLLGRAQATGELCT